MEGFKTIETYVFDDPDESIGPGVSPVIQIGVWPLERGDKVKVEYKITKIE